MSVERVEQFSKRYQQPAVCALLPVSTDSVTNKEMETATTIEINSEPSAGESKERESFQWKPNQASGGKREFHDYTWENSNPDGAVSLAMPYVHKRVRPQKVFAVMRSPYFEVDGEIRRVNLGFIERIDHIFRRDGNKTYFVHFADGRFSKGSLERDILERMASGERFKVFNDREQEHFWWISVSKAKRPSDKNEAEASADITIDLQ